MMKVYAIAFILATVTGFGAAAEDWMDRRLNQRSPLDSNRYATEEETYRAILEYDANRARMLKQHLDQHERRLEEHVSGRRLLHGDEHERTLRQIKVFAHHLDKLEAETRMEKMEKVDDARRSMYNMHRNDYLDYGKTGLN